MSWAVLADDFTGALDTGLQFARHGLTTVFDLGTGGSLADALVLSSDSRALPPAAAADAAAAIAQRAAGPGVRYYKKVDSTLRGNLGPELAGIMRVTGVRTAILAPAYPDQGRTTVGGVQFIDGVPITATEIARDPQSPVREADILKILATTSDLVPVLLPLVTVRAGIDATRAGLYELAATADVIVADAETDADLATIADAAGSAGLSSGSASLFAGSAGLADHLIAGSGLTKAGEAGFPIPHPVAGRVAVIAGSFSGVTRAQVVHAAAALHTAPHIPTPDDHSDPDSAIAAAVRQLQRQSVWMTHPGAGRRDLSPPQVDRLSNWISTLVAGLAGAIPDIGLVLTGGETASLGVHGLGATGIRIAAEVSPGIPGGLLIGGIAAGRPVVTKAGGFGEPSALLDAVRWLQSG